MVDVEDEIRDSFPEVYSALFPRWISASAKASHEPGDSNRHCGICIARTGTPQLPRGA